MFNLSKPITEHADGHAGKPAGKWIEITVGDHVGQEHHYRASFLTDVPGDLLDGAIEMLRDRYPFVLEIDTREDGFYSFVNSPLHLALFVTNGERVVKTAYEDPLELAQYILCYVNENKEECYRWLSYMGDGNEAAVIAYREALDLKVAELTQLVAQEIEQRKEAV